MQSSLKTHYSVDFIKAYSVDDTYYLVFCSYFDSVCIWIKMPFVQGLWKCFGGFFGLEVLLNTFKTHTYCFKDTYNNTESSWGKAV